jgi:hypothetical protein
MNERVLAKQFNQEKDQCSVYYLGEVVLERGWSGKLIYCAYLHAITIVNTRPIVKDEFNMGNHAERQGMTRQF